jgi:hypothetical protein
MMMIAFRVVAATVGLFALTLQFLLMVNDPSDPKLGATTINFFSYFTILTNGLVAVSMLVPTIAPASRAGQLLNRPSVRTMNTSYSAVVALVYFFFLRNVGGDEDWELLADRLLHYVVPAMVMIDWLVFGSKGHVPWTIVGTSLVVPILYGAWTLLHGALTGWYPYSFFDVTRIGYAKTLVNFAAFLCMFVAMALALFLLDRLVALLVQQGKASQ